MMTNDVGTCSWLVEELVAARIAERSVLAPHLEDFTAECPYADADAFAKHLAREGILTRYQASRAVDGEAKKLVLGPYLLVQVIGYGSLGPVYLARGRADGRPYAVKLLPQRAWSVRLARSQVRGFEEMPPDVGAVPFIDVGTAHGVHYLVWPFAEGRSLESIVPECGPLSPGEVAGIGLQLASALKRCHGRGLIHGLIKPSNVLIDLEGHARLLDFGVGALLADNADDEALVDTVSRAEALARMLECCSPESVVDSSRWTPAGDQYSLGCTLYFAATGRFPFPGGTFVDKIRAHQSAQPAPIRSLNPDVPPGLADTIDRLMQKSPSDRYRRLDELMGELKPLVGGSRIRVPAPVNVETPAPNARLSLTGRHYRAANPASPGALPIAEPAAVALSLDTPRKGSSLLGRLFGGAAAEEKLGITVVAAGPIHPGETVILHVYAHGVSEARDLEQTLRDLPEAPVILGAGQSRRSIVTGSVVGLHLSLTGACVAEPLQEFERAATAELHRFTVTLPADASLEPLRGKLMVGQDGRLLTEVCFVLAVQPL